MGLLSALAEVATSTETYPAGEPTLPTFGDHLRAPSACELADFVSDVRVQVGHPTLVSPIKRDAVGRELERLVGRDAIDASSVGAQVGISVPSTRAIWKRVRVSARRVSAKRAPILAKGGSGFEY